MKARDAAVRYIAARKNMIKCRQAMFKQMCTTCKYYKHSTCKVYNAYVKAWMELQRSVDESVQIT